jgi:hypothetical protein
VLTYADGERVTLPAGAVLRLTDPTPAVTVNGAHTNFAPQSY